MEYIVCNTLYQETLQNSLINSSNLPVLFLNCYIHKHTMTLGLPKEVSVPGMVKAEVQIFIPTVHQGANKRKMIPSWE